MSNHQKLLRELLDLAAGQIRATIDRYGLMPYIEQGDVHVNLLSGPYMKSVIVEATGHWTMRSASWSQSSRRSGSVLRLDSEAPMTPLNARMLGEIDTFIALLATRVRGAPDRRHEEDRDGIPMWSVLVDPVVPAILLHGHRHCARPIDDLGLAEREHHLLVEPIHGAGRHDHERACVYEDGAAYMSGDGLGMTSWKVASRGCAFYPGCEAIRDERGTRVLVRGHDVQAEPGSRIDRAVWMLGRSPAADRRIVSVERTSHLWWYHGTPRRATALWLEDARLERMVYGPPVDPSWWRAMAAADAAYGPAVLHAERQAGCRRRIGSSSD